MGESTVMIFLYFQDCKVLFGLLLSGCEGLSQIFYITFRDSVCSVCNKILKCEKTYFTNQIQILLLLYAVNL